VADARRGKDAEDFGSNDKILQAEQPDSVFPACPMARSLLNISF
jgi:hypothetical protein